MLYLHRQGQLRTKSHYANSLIYVLTPYLLINLVIQRILTHHVLIIMEYRSNEGVRLIVVLFNIRPDRQGG